MKKAEVEHVKALASRTRDRARLSYDKLTTEAPRQCVFIATTNEIEYLRDQTVIGASGQFDASSSISKC